MPLLKTAGKLGAALTGVGKQSFQNHPVASSILALGGATFLGKEVGAPLVSGLNNGGLRRAVTEDFESRSIERNLGARVNRLRATMAENEARLATVDPHAYAELRTKQRLPIGARVYGDMGDRGLLERALFETTQ